MMDWKGCELKRSLEACVLNYYNPDSKAAGLVTACGDVRTAGL